MLAFTLGTNFTIGAALGISFACGFKNCSISSAVANSSPKKPSIDRPLPIETVCCFSNSLSPFFICLDSPTLTNLSSI